MIIQGKYLQILGNNTLTGYNSELSDRPYEEKKTMEGGFDDSPIRLNQFMRQTNTWNKQSIEQRTTQLGAKAVDVWFAPALSPGMLQLYRSNTGERSEYDIDHYEYLRDDMLTLYKALRKRILNLDPTVRVEFKKLYIAFKVFANVVDVVPLKSRLRLFLNVPYDEIHDPKGLTRDVSTLGHWGNGDVEVGISRPEELDEVMELIQQAYERQIEG